MKSIMRLIMSKMPARPDVFEYGRIGNGVGARRNKFTGEVQFLLWMAGEQGHSRDYFHRVGDGWPQTFIPDQS